MNILLDNVEFKKVLPKDYRLFQMADFICTMQLLELKMEQKLLSRSELYFFENERTLKKKISQTNFKQRTQQYEQVLIR